MKKTLALCLICMTLAAAPVFADPITYSFTAELSLINNLDVPGDPVAGLSLGDIVTGSFTYERGLPLNPGFNTSRQQLIDDLGGIPLPAGDPTPDTGDFYFHDGMADDVSESFEVFGGPGFGGGSEVFNITIEIAGTSFSFGGDSLIRHRTNEWVITPDRPAYAYDTMFAFGLDAAGYQGGIRLMDDGVFTGTFPSDQTLTTLPDLADIYLARVFGIIDSDGNGIEDAQVFARVTSMTSVPEPSTLALFGLGLAGIGLVRRRRKS